MIDLDNDALGFAPAIRFERIAGAQPDALAIAQGASEWTYGDVLKASRRYAQALSTLNAGDEVALVFGHNAEAIIAMMGALRAGTLCLPIDPLAPPMGVEQILAECRLIVTQEQFLPWCRTVAGNTPILNGPEAVAKIQTGADLPPAKDHRPDEPYAVYFTSGTKGAPKGALQTQRRLERTVSRMIQAHGHGPADRHAMFASFAFSGSIQVFPGALMTGGAIDIIDLRDKNTMDFAQQVRGRGITTLTMTSSLLRALVDALAGTSSDWQPRLISISGEPLFTQDVVKMREILGWKSKVVHRLANSEVGIVAEWEVDLDLCDPDGIVPAGYPSPGREIAFLDDSGAELPPGHIGELVIKGKNLSNGYWKRPELTQQAYVDISTPETPGLMRYHSGDLGKLNANGLLEFIGRKGSMTKIRGYSVEMDSVEAAMRQIDGVVNAIAAVQSGRNDNSYLLGYVQRSRRKKLTAHSVRAALQEELPDFMVPKRILVLDDLPLTAGGKIDRRKLPPVDRGRPSGMNAVVPPVGPTEIALARIWSDVLEIDEISRDDDFFELGGDSLDALSVAMSIQKEMGMNIEESELFFVSGLTAMATLLQNFGGTQNLG